MNPVSLMEGSRATFWALPFSALMLSMLPQGINRHTCAVFRGLASKCLLPIEIDGARSSDRECQIPAWQRRLERFSDDWPHACLTVFCKGIFRTSLSCSRIASPSSVSHIKGSVRYAHKFAPPTSENIVKLRAAIQKNLQPICFYVKNDYTMGHHVYDQHFRVCLQCVDVRGLGAFLAKEPVYVFVALRVRKLFRGFMREWSAFVYDSVLVFTLRESYVHHFLKARRTLR